MIGLIGSGNERFRTLTYLRSRETLGNAETIVIVTQSVSTRFWKRKPDSAGFIGESVSGAPPFPPETETAETEVTQLLDLPPPLAVGVPPD
jgi:hypothetical protein